MAIRVFGDRRSGNCLKVKWILDYLSVPFEWVEIDVVKGGARTPESLARNPAGQVPAVELEDGRTLAQSNALMLHFADGSDLIPADPYDRAKMLEWLFWEQYSHEPYIAVRRYQVAILGRDPAELDPRLFERGSAALRRMEAGLDGRDWLVGDRLSLADVALVAYTRCAHEAGFNLALYPAVAAWVRRVDTALGIDR